MATKLVQTVAPITSAGAASTQSTSITLNTGLIIYKPNFTARVEQIREAQLFYNENSNVGSGIMTRSSVKKEFKFRFISFN